MSTIHRVFGPPGCGKTTYLAKQAERASQKYGRDGVLVASLTKAAATEAAGRTDLGPAQVGTLHAHAYRSLGRPELIEVGEHIKEWNATAPPNWKSRQRDLDFDMQSNMEISASAHERDDYADYMRLRTACVPRDQWPASISAFAVAWETFKRDRNGLDFTDLIEQATTETEHAPGEPGVILLDEAQDLSTLEMRLAHRWGASAESVVIVGDPDQCLYRWRGSDPDVFAMDEAATERTLEQSYRVPRRVHEHAVRWIERVDGRIPISYHPTDQEGSVVKSAGGMHAPEQLAEELTACPGTSMVLGACSYQLNGVIAELRRKGTPFHNPYRSTHGGWNPLAGARRVLALMSWLAPEDGGQARPWTYDDVRRWIEPLKATGFVSRGIKEQIDLRCARDQYGNAGGDEEVSGGMLDALFVSRDDLIAATNGDLAWYREHLLPSYRARLDYPLRVAEMHGGAALRTEPRIVVGTIHSVKGGEADDVFVMPDLSNSGWWSGWNVPGEGRASVRRLFYVAFTRARSNLHLLEGGSDRRVPWS